MMNLASHQGPEGGAEGGAKGGAEGGLTRYIYIFPTLVVKDGRPLLVWRSGFVVESR